MTHKRRTLSISEKAAVIKRQDGFCNCGCQERVEVGAINYDHVIPIGLGGTNALANFQALTIGHHAEKTSKEATARAKTNRIRARDGLMKPRLSEKDKALARLMERA